MTAIDLNYVPALDAGPPTSVRALWRLRITCGSLLVVSAFLLAACGDAPDAAAPEDTAGVTASAIDLSPDAYDIATYSLDAAFTDLTLGEDIDDAEPKLRAAMPDADVKRLYATDGRTLLVARDGEREVLAVFTPVGPLTTQLDAFGARIP